MAWNYLYVTQAGAGGGTGADWANAFSQSEWITDMASSSVWDLYVVEGGTTYTLTGAINVSTTSGTSSGYVGILGVVAGTTNEGSSIDINDWAFGDDRPFLDGGTSYYLRVGAYWVIQNIRIASQDTLAFRTNNNSVVINCKAVNSSASANRWAFYSPGSSTRFEDCEGESTNGVAFYLGDLNFCATSYAHDSDVAYNMLGRSTLSESVADTCTTGIEMTNPNSVTIRGNTIYNCTTGINATSAYDTYVINNNISDCTTGVSWTSETAVYFDFNNWYNNTNDFPVSNTNVSKGASATAVDPNFTNAAGGDFSTDAAGIQGTARGFTLGVA